MKPTILIIDDSPSVHQILASCFSQEPWHVCSAYSGAEGLSVAATRGAEVVLLDVDLPDMNGFDVCRHLRGEAGPSSVIFLTASSTVDEKVCGLRVGGVDYVTKPFDPAEVIERVRNSLQTRRLLDRLPDPGERDAGPAASSGVSVGRAGSAIEFWSHNGPAGRAVSRPDRFA